MSLSREALDEDDELDVGGTQDVPQGPLSTDERNDEVPRYREELAVLPTDGAARATAVTNLAKALMSRYDEHGEDGDLDECIRLHEEALDSCDDVGSHRGMCLDVLGRALFVRYCHRDTIDDLTRSIDRYRAALVAYPPGHPDRFHVLECLARGQRCRFNELGHIVDLNDAISSDREALTACSPVDPTRASVLIHFARCLLERYKSTSRAKDIEESLALCQEAVEVTFHGHPKRYAALDQLAVTLVHRFDILGDASDLRRMLTVQTEILDICPPGNENRPKALSQLAAGRLIRFEKEAVIDDLEESIRLFRESAKSMGKDDDDYPLAINNLANGIHTRYEQLGNAADLHESIQLYREALSYLTKGDYDRAAALNNLANALLSSWKDFAVSDDLQESIRLQRESLVLQPEPQSDRPLYLNNLANCLYEKFKRGGDMAEISDLDESISVFRQALDLVAEEDPERSTYIRNRGLSHHTRFQRFGDSEDAEQARVLFADALALLPPGRSDRARCLFLTANLYLEPSTSFYDPRTALTQLKEALSDDHYNAQLRLNEAVTTLERTTGIAAADIDVDTENGRALRAALLQAHTHTIRLLPRAAYFGLNIRTRLRALRSAERLALECATHALRLGRLEVAVETLEEGRGVFWTQALRLRTPFDDLPPDVRQELVDLSRKLEQDSYEQAVELDPEDTQAKAIAEDNAASRRRQSVLFDAKMDEVRRLPGFERFMLPATFSTLLSASIDGPVAILVASSAACDALILRPSGDAQCVSLKIGIPRLEELGTLLLEANQQLRGAPASASEDRKMKRVITGHQETRMGAVDVLKEIWKTVVKPVIDSLQLQRSTGRTRPRLWWMPTGQFAFLPIHAAGISSAHGGEWCSDYVVSSYTPTLSALLSARRDFRPIPRREAKILLAAVPHPFQGSDLPCTVDEVVHIKDAVPADMLLPLPEADDASLGFRLGTGASLPTMLEMLPKATMLHLACHGWQHPSNPLDSGFILRDAMLTIAELMPLPLPHAFLAFLSACETAKGDKSQPDQTVHLAATMLFAGFKSVVGTMWSMNDMDGPVVAQKLYEELLSGDSEFLDPAAVPYALDASVQELRSKGLHPSRWAPYVHIGV